MRRQAVGRVPRRRGDGEAGEAREEPERDSHLPPLRQVHQGPVGPAQAQPPHQQGPREGSQVQVQHVPVDFLVRVAAEETQGG